MKGLGSVLIAFIAFLGHYDLEVVGVDLEIDLRLTLPQKALMDKFKKMMIPKLPHRYMHEEIYLVRWLRARNFDLKKAEEFLLQNLRWRKQHKIDSILKDNFDDIKEEFPYTIGDSFDKQGRPIVCAVARRWDLRNAVVTGRVKRALRYLDRSMEEASGMIRKMQLEGHNVTQFVLILHMGHFNLFQHGCPRCITGILEFVDSYENHYPGLADKILLVQTPPAFEAVGALVREAASPATREAMKIYGFEPKVWKKALLDFIDASQLTEEFGGTRPDPYY